MATKAEKAAAKARKDSAKRDRKAEAAKAAGPAQVVDTPNAPVRPRAVVDPVINPSPGVVVSATKQYKNEACFVVGVKKPTPQGGYEINWRIRLQNGIAVGIDEHDSSAIEHEVFQVSSGWGK